MELHLVLLSTILAFALVSTEQSVSSPTTTTTTSTTKPNSSPYSDTSMPGAIEPSTTGTTSTTTTATHSTPTTTTISSTTTPKSCPSGYQLYPEFNCYKAFNDTRKTWSEARDQCVREGGELMVMETERERQDVYIPLSDTADFYYNPWVGVYKPEGEDGWMSVNGEPALSTWWWPVYPVKNAAAKCAFAVFTGQLVNWDCAATQNFICEISL